MHHDTELQRLAVEVGTEKQGGLLGKLGARLHKWRWFALFVIAIAAAVFGMVSYERLPLTLMPDMSYPTVTVRTEHKLSGPSRPPKGRLPSWRSCPKRRALKGRSLLSAAARLYT